MWTRCWRGAGRPPREWRVRARVRSVRDRAWWIRPAARPPGRRGSRETKEDLTPSPFPKREWEQNGNGLSLFSPRDGGKGAMPGESYNEGSVATTGEARNSG